MANDSATDVNELQTASQNLPFSLPLELTVQDEDTIQELLNYTEGDEREQFALKALRIGVLALRQARGEIDAERIRRESERLLESLDRTLDRHACLINERVTGVLKEYFDPQNGRFQERVERLIKQDGELEEVLRRHIGSDDSQLCKTLATHFGQGSQLMKLLSPDQSKGLLAALRQLVEEQLNQQREHVLSQFSLDNKAGALARFISELTDRQGQLSEELHGKIDEVIKEFSLDQENSALSRLVQNVDRAQRTITSEFSLDNEASALFRLKRELLTVLEQQTKANQEFQQDVTKALEAIKARREESARSTRHGLEFEDAVFEAVQHESQRVGDIATHTGNTTGQIKNCKVGDCVIELGPDSAAPAARIAIEAKEKSGYDLATARHEIETARKNRGAQVGLFVFSKKTAPVGLEPFARFGNDVVVVWDHEDDNTDIFLHAGLTLARALCIRVDRQHEAAEADFSAIDSAILEIEKRTANLADVTKWAETIRGNADKIINQIATSQKSLERQLRVLQEKTEDLKQVHN